MTVVDVAAAAVTTVACTTRHYIVCFVRTKNTRELVDYIHSRTIANRAYDTRIHPVEYVCFPYIRRGMYVLIPGRKIVDIVQLVQSHNIKMLLSPTRRIHTPYKQISYKYTRRESVRQHCRGCALCCVGVDIFMTK